MLLRTKNITASVKIFISFYQTDLSISGNLEVSLKFLPPQSLFLTVHGASGLSRRRDGHVAQAFVKVSVPGLGAVFKTGVTKMPC